MSSLIYEGVMDAFPRIKILNCHGGGYLPFYAGRADITQLRLSRAPARQAFATLSPWERAGVRVGLDSLGPVE